MIRAPLLGSDKRHSLDQAPTRDQKLAASLALVAGVAWLDWYADGSLVVLDVGLACCALEFEAAALHAAADHLTWPGRLSDEARVAVVISGTVTDRLAPGVVALVDAAAELGGRRPTVISFGACASSGGPYWDSYAVTKGVDQLVAVDVFVPGCPPPPEALHAVLDGLR
jgi:NADH-quinone oxidoreductase subunit B